MVANRPARRIRRVFLRHIHPDARRSGQADRPGTGTGYPDRPSGWKPALCL